MPLAPEHPHEIRDEATQGERAMDAGMAGGAERDQRPVIPRPAVMHVQYIARAAGLAAAAVPLEHPFAVAAEGPERMPPAPITGGAKTRRAWEGRSTGAEEGALSGGGGGALPCPGGWKRGSEVAGSGESHGESGKRGSAANIPDNSYYRK